MVEYRVGQKTEAKYSFELVLGILNIIIIFHAFLSIDKMHIKPYKIKLK